MTLFNALLSNLNRWVLLSTLLLFVTVPSFVAAQPSGPVRPTLKPGTVAKPIINPNLPILTRQPPSGNLVTLSATSSVATFEVSLSPTVRKPESVLEVFRRFIDFTLKGSTRAVKVEIKPKRTLRTLNVDQLIAAPGIRAHVDIREAWFHALGPKPARAPCPRYAILGYGALQPDRGAIQLPSGTYCRYTWQGNGPGLRPIATDFRQVTGLEPLSITLSGGGVVSNGTVLSPKQSGYKERRREREYYLRRAGAFSSRVRNRLPVDIAVLDDIDRDSLDRSGADVYPQPAGCGYHGVTVTRVVQDLACPMNYAECPVRVRAYNVLPLGLEPSRTPRVPATLARMPCGSAGDASTFKEGIDRVLRDHTPLRRPLVINASVGASSRATKIERELVMSALHKAACAGAIIVAAAGNDDTPHSPPAARGVMSPAIAAFDRTELACGDIERPKVPRGQVLAQHVISAGGVNNGASVSTLGLSRHQRGGSTLAFAHRVVGEVVKPGGPYLLPPTTGTSMSTAVVTGSLAALLSRGPKQLVPFKTLEKVKHLTTSTYPLVATTRYRGSPSTRRPLIATAALINNLCGGLGCATGAVPAHPSAPRPPHAQKRAGAQTINLTGPFVFTPPSTAPRNETPLLGPQPTGVGACRECDLKNNVLLLDWDPNTRADLENFNLVVRVNNTDVTVPLSSLSPGATGQVEIKINHPQLQSGQVHNAKLTADYAKTSQSVASEIDVH